MLFLFRRPMLRGRSSQTPKAPDEFRKSSRPGPLHQSPTRPNAMGGFVDVVVLTALSIDETAGAHDTPS